MSDREVRRDSQENKLPIKSLLKGIAYVKGKQIGGGGSPIVRWLSHKPGGFLCLLAF